MPKPESKPAPRRLAARKAPTKAKAATKPPAEKGTNWAAIELAVTTTARTYDDIGREFGVTKGRISQKAKELGWKRGAMADRVRAQAAAKVAAQEAHAARVEAGTEEAIDASATLMANTILRERRDVARLVRVANLLADRVEAAAVQAAAGKKPRKSDPKPDPLGVQVDNLRKLGTTMSNLIELERSVLGITAATPIDPTRRIEEAVESGMDALRERFKQRGVKV